MSARRRSRPSGKAKESKQDVQYEQADLDVIFAKACETLQQSLSAKDVGAARRASFFVSKFSEEFEHALSEEVQAQIQEVDALMLEWKNNLGEGDLADFLSPKERKWFSVKLIELSRETAHIRVHYQGWDSKFDESFELTDDMVILPPYSVIPNPRKQKASVAQPASTAPESVEEAVAEEVAVAVAPSTETTSSSAGAGNATAEQQQQPPPQEQEENGGRARRSRRASAEQAASPVKTKKTAKEKGPKVEKDHNDWFCTNCGMLEAVQGTDLVLCDGLCRRSFHLECLSRDEHANYTAQMASGDEDAKYFCAQCRTSQHSCFLCGKVGVDYLVSGAVRRVRLGATVFDGTRWCMRMCVWL